MHPEFRLLDVCLALCGCKLFLPNRVIRAANSAQLVLLMTTSFLSFVDGLVVDSPLKDKWLLYHASYIIKYPLGIAFQVQLRRSARDLRSLLRFLLSRLSQSRRSLLHKSGLIYASLVLLTTIATTPVFVMGAVRYFFNESYWVRVILIAELLAILGRWILTGLALTGFLVRAISLMEESLIEEATRCLVKEFPAYAPAAASVVGVRRRKPSGGDKCITLAHLGLRIQESILAKRSVMRLMGAFPLFVAAYLFTAVAGLIVKLKNGGTHDYTWNEVSLLLIMLAGLSWLCHSADSQREDNLELLDRLCLMVATRKARRGGCATGDQELAAADAILADMRTLVTTPYESCSLIRLDRSFLLAFASTLFTVTALLIQVSGDMQAALSAG